MKTVKTILVRSCKTPVLLGIGKQSEIIETAIVADLQFRTVTVDYAGIYIWSLDTED